MSILCSSRRFKVGATTFQSGAEAHALHALARGFRRMANAKRLECVRFTAAFPQNAVNHGGRAKYKNLSIVDIPWDNRYSKARTQIDSYG
jgi:hypothetical protein